MPCPLVSFVLPVHNGARYLEDAVRSIRRQTFHDFELLIIDDASTDGTEELAASLASQEPRIRVLRHSSRLGVSSALNEGIAMTHAPFIARMDADDICSPCRLEKQVAFLTKNPSLGLCGSWVRCFGSVRPYVLTYPCDPDTIRAYLLFGNPFSHPAVLFRRAALDRHNLRYDTAVPVAQDLELWSRCIDCFPTDNLPAPLLHYRFHPSSVSVSCSTDSLQTAMTVVGNQLLKLGLSLDSEAFSFHFNIARGGVLGGKNKLQRVEQWLSHLVRRNDTLSAYPPEGFRRACGFVWFRACLNAAVQGPWVWATYAQSPLRRNHRPTMQERLAFLCFPFRRWLSPLIPRSTP